MKNIADKFKTGVKAVGSGIVDTAVKYLPKPTVKTVVTLGAIALGTLAYKATNAQAADPYISKLPAMDFYSQPNVVQGNEKGTYEFYGSGSVDGEKAPNMETAQKIYMGFNRDEYDVDGNGTVNAADGKIIEDLVNGEIDHLPSDWNKLSPAEKESWADKMVLLNIKEGIQNYKCGDHATRALFNFTGIKNSKEWKGFDHFDGTPIDFSKYEAHVDIGKFNIPLYMAGLELDSGEGHYWVKALLGDREGNEETNPFNRDHWKVYNFYDGTEVTEDGPYLNENALLGPSTKYWNEKEQKHESRGLFDFDLSDNASITPKYVNNNALFQSPHEAIVDLKKMGDVYVEAHTADANLSEENIGKPALETNLKKHYFALNAEFPDLLGPTTDYMPIVSHKDEKKVFDERYPEYFEVTRTYKAATDNMGRWNSKNLENLADSTSFKIIVDDTTAPEVTAPEDITIGKNASMSIENTGIATATDASPYPLEKWVEDVELSNDGVYRVVERTHFAQDVRGNMESDVQKITQDLGTGIEELSATKSFDLDQNYPNPVIGTTIVPYASMGGDLDFKLVDMNGVIRKVFEKDNTFMGEGTFQLNMNGMAPGQYILMGNDEKGSVDQIILTKTNL